MYVGSAVTILQEDVWREAGSSPMTGLHRPVVAAYEEELGLLGQTQVTITLGKFSAVHLALILDGTVITIDETSSA